MSDVSSTPVVNVVEVTLPWNLTYVPAIGDALLEAGFDLNSPYNVEILSSGDHRYFQAVTQSVPEPVAE